MKVIKYEDFSKTFRTDQETYVIKIILIEMVMDIIL